MPVAGLKGKREAKHLPNVSLENFNAGAPLEAVSLPTSADMSNGWTQWGMLGNGPDPNNLPCYPNGAGDCHFAAFGHLRMAHAGLAFPGFVPPHTPYTQHLYAAYGKHAGEAGECPDQGVVMSDALLWLYQQTKLHPGDDEIAFAEVDLTGPDGPARLKRAILDFGGVLGGFQMDARCNDEFNAGVPFGTYSMKPDPDEGHVMYLVGYDDPHDVWLPVTWAVKYHMLSGYFALMDEAWVVGTKEQMSRAGYHWPSLVAELDAMADAHGPVVAFPDVPVAPDPAPPAPGAREWPSVPESTSGGAQGLLARWEALADRLEALASRLGL